MLGQRFLSGEAFVGLTPLTSAFRGSGRGTTLARTPLQAAEAQAKSKVEEVYDLLRDRRSADQAAPVVQFMEPSTRSEFAYLLDEKPQEESEYSGQVETEEGDTARIVYNKLRSIKDDDELLAFRAKLQTVMREALQDVTEKEQAFTALALDSLQYSDEEEAEQAWQFFSKQFPKAVERGVFMTTPCKEADVKYRWRRLKATLEVDSDFAVMLMSKDSSPLFVDPDFIERAFRKMCAGLDGGREEALTDLVAKHPGSLIVDASLIQEQLGQAKITAAAIDASRGITNFFRNEVFDNGRKVPIGRRDGPAPFGGGLPAWKREWEAEMKRREELEKANKEA